MNTRLSHRAVPFFAIVALVAAAFAFAFGTPVALAAEQGAGSGVKQVYVAADGDLATDTVTTVSAEPEVV